MFLPIPIKHRRRRQRRLRAAETPAPPPLNVLGVEDIVQEQGTLALTAVFDTTAEQPLAGVAGAAAGQWAAHFTENLYTGASLAQIAFDRIRISFDYSDYQPGAPTDLVYPATPSDIADTAGRKLAAFVLPFSE